MRLDYKKPIKVLIVDDSLLIRESLAAHLSADPELKVVATAANGLEAVGMVDSLEPDIVIMDIVMPEMDGFEATERIMAVHPVPIVVFTASLEGENDEVVYKALELGALSVVKKPRRIDQLSHQFIRKIKLLSNSTVITHMRGKQKAKKDISRLCCDGKIKKGQVVGIVCSTGGPTALKNVLSQLPADFPAGVVIVQHLSDGFEKELISWLNLTSGIEIRPAVPGKKIKPGIAYLAVSGYHLVVREHEMLDLVDSAPVWSLKPSGDVLLSSIAEVYGYKATGVILTGMGRDGAEGLKQIKKAGGRTIAQDETTSLIFGMPKRAIQMGIIDKIVPLGSISDEIIRGLHRYEMDKI
jgi:two-component system chemotaxis response regulator CheB